MATSLVKNAPVLKSHHDVLEYNQQRYFEGVRNGEYTPVTYPMFTYGLAVLILFMLVPPNSIFHISYSRYLVFALTSAWHIFLISCCKAHGSAVGFGIGIISAWGVLWSAVLLLFNDAKVDWVRVKRECTSGDADRSEPDEGTTSGSLHANGTDVRHRKEMASVSKVQAGSSSKNVNGKVGTYRWQHYPTTASMAERWDWTLDAISNFRGMGWNWAGSNLPSRPPYVEGSLQSNGNDMKTIEDKRTSRSGVARFDTISSCLLHNLWIAFKGYIMMDILKTVMNHDPYFWGLVDHPPPSWLPHIITGSAPLTRAYRLLVSMCGIWMALRTVYSFGPLFFVGVLGPRRIGANGEPWMYPDHFGSYSQVFERGLSGWWGAWWHQIFRFAFQTGGNWIADDLLGLKHPMIITSTKLCVAFALSGFLHASGSITMTADTYPWSGSFVFFLLQPVGIMIETGWRSILERLVILDRTPLWIAWACNFAWAHAWLYMTGPLLTDDFARGGIWLFEPVMLSLLRGLGFGVEGDGWYCWGGRIAEWHHDKRWWLSGLAL